MKREREDRGGGGRPLRVLHAAAEIAGQPGLLARGLRALGVDARSLSAHPSWLGYPSDRALDGRGPRGLFRRIQALIELGPGLDILHLHFGTSLLPHLIDVPILARLGTRIVFHFHGCEVRPRARMLAEHPISACSECPVYCVPARQDRLLALARHHGALLLVSTPDLLEAVPEAVHLPVAIDLEAWEVRRRAARPAPGFVVLHAPSDPAIKGTRHVEAAVNALAAHHPEVRLELIVREPAARAHARYGTATVAVDQVHLGWYGLFAVEAMALGLPVLCYIRPSLDRPALPVLRTDRERLAADLATLYREPERRRALGAAGRAYVEAEHALPVLSERLLALYRTRVLGDSSKSKAAWAGSPA
jgi:glycosyltransferase involved in cell wall biosynthesis